MRGSPSLTEIGFPVAILRLCRNIDQGISTEYGWLPSSPPLSPHQGSSPHLRHRFPLTIRSNWAQRSHQSQRKIRSRESYRFPLMSALSTEVIHSSCYWRSCNRLSDSNSLVCSEVFYFGQLKPYESAILQRERRVMSKKTPSLWSITELTAAFLHLTHYLPDVQRKIWAIMNTTHPQMYSGKKKMALLYLALKPEPENLISPIFLYITAQLEPEPSRGTSCISTYNVS